MSLQPTAGAVDLTVEGPTEKERFPIADTLCSVVSNDAVNDRYRHLVLAAPDSALTAHAGQFFHLLCPQAGENRPYLRRPMSVYRVDPARERVEFLYKPVGSGTRAMATLRPGDGFKILGPLGNGFNLNPEWRRILVLGRGVGLATLAPLAEAAAALGIGITVILSVERLEYLMSVALFESVGARVIPVTDEDGGSAVDKVEALVRDECQAGGVDAFFTCGSNRLIQLLKKLGSELGIPGEVALEQQMACGIGMCFCCVRSFEVEKKVVHRRVCCEGPVFDLQETLSW